MIEWKSFSDEIINLSNKGMSSSQIQENLISKGKIPRTPGGDRYIRRLLKRHRESENNEVLSTIPVKVLVFDIETLPGVGYFWGRWNTNIAEKQIIKSSCVLGWSAKWLFEDEMYSSFLTPKEVEKRDDSRIMKNLWNMLEEADIVIAHNGVKFDMKIVTGRFFLHGMAPHSSVKMIDTLKHLRSKMKLESNRLDSVAKALGLKGKIETDFELWKSCDEGDKQAIHDMMVYCEQDVRVLEDVYFAMRPYIKPHPNMGCI
jgi:DNA polymerase elongation subunit (family B)